MLDAGQPSLRGFLGTLFGSDRPPAVPPIAPGIVLAPPDEAEDATEPADDPDELQSIAGFVCVIQYRDEGRFITCRRYDTIGDLGYVGAVCQSGSGRGYGYRQFRVDRIAEVLDPYTGEVLGDGGYFARFAVDTRRGRAPTFGLTPNRAGVLVAGLNILAYVAHCDGHWHPLEDEPVERFVASMWLRKEWDGDPPLDEIMAHAKRLAPDSSIALKALKYYARSDTSTRVLLNSIAQLIDADGIIRPEETTCVNEIADAIDDLQQEALRATMADGGPVIRLPVSGGG